MTQRIANRTLGDAGRWAANVAPAAADDGVSPEPSLTRV